MAGSELQSYELGDTIVSGSKALAERLPVGAIVEAPEVTFAQRFRETRFVLSVGEVVIIWFLTMAMFLGVLVYGIQHGRKVGLQERLATAGQPALELALTERTNSIANNFVVNDEKIVREVAKSDTALAAEQETRAELLRELDQDIAALEEGSDSNEAVQSSKSGKALTRGLPPVKASGKSKIKPKQNVVVAKMSPPKPKLATLPAQTLDGQIEQGASSSVLPKKAELEAPAPRTQLARASKGGKWFLRRSFSLNKDQAVSFIGEARTAGFSAGLQTVKAGDQDSFRVLIGPFRSGNDAQSAQKRFGGVLLEYLQR